MSWWGSHPKIDKAEARRLLPAAACRECVYYARVYSGLPPGVSGCARCSGRSSGDWWKERLRAKHGR